MVTPIFKALVLSSGFLRDFDNEANAIALSAESRISNIIKIGKSVSISDQLSIWSNVGINELTDKASI